jgi:hypothetical protein
MGSDFEPLNRVFHGFSVPALRPDVLLVLEDRPDKLETLLVLFQEINFEFHQHFFLLDLAGN